MQTSTSLTHSIIHQFLNQNDIIRKTCKGSRPPFAHLRVICSSAPRHTRTRGAAPALSAALAKDFGVDRGPCIGSCMLHLHVACISAFACMYSSAVHTGTYLLSAGQEQERQGKAASRISLLRLATCGLPCGYADGCVVKVEVV
jgi:hypothetical protein